MLEVRQLCLKYESKPLWAGLSLNIRQGEIVALTGPSGSGKTSLLRCIAGLEQPDSGSIWVNGREITTTPTHQRRIGMVFQDNQLFPHLNVGDNVGYSLRNQRVAKNIRQAKVSDALNLVGLAHLAERKITRLSGGEAKRIAVARSLVAQPNLLLLDEPLNGLDPELHQRLLGDLNTLFRSQGMTILHVTHNREEAQAIADRVIDIRQLTS